MAGKFELRVSRNGKHYFQLKARNGQVILMSEMFESKAAAENCIASVQKNAPDEGRYERRRDEYAPRAGYQYFMLKAGNGHVIGKSEYYMSAAARDNGIESVRVNAPNAVIVEV